MWSLLSSTSLISHVMSCSLFEIKLDDVTFTCPRIFLLSCPLQGTFSLFYPKTTQQPSSSQPHIPLLFPHHTEEGLKSPSPIYSSIQSILWSPSLSPRLSQKKPGPHFHPLWGLMYAWTISSKCQITLFLHMDKQIIMWVNVLKPKRGWWCFSAGR